MGEHDLYFQPTQAAEMALLYEHCALSGQGELEGEATGLEDKDRADAGGKHRSQPARRH